MTDLCESSAQTIGYAYGINNRGQVVGYVGSLSGGFPFLWEDGVVYDPNDLIPADSGWLLWKALDINDAGWIVGEGEFRPDSRTRYEQRALLLIPVPEPASVLLLVAALAAAGWHARPGRSAF